MARDYYQVLGVERGASDSEIKSSFRRLARELHPDVNSHDPQAEDKFKQAAEAYEVLSDPERRRTYDTFGAEGLRSGGWRPGGQGFSSFDDIFQTFFGGGFGPQGPAAGGDVGAAIEITLAEVLSGAEREVSFEVVAVCEHCRGNGAEPGTPIHTCDRCDGAGQLRQVSRSMLGQVVRAVVCDRCGGEGKIPETPCKECQGAGRVPATRSWEVEVPPGIEDGQRIRIGGAGHAGDAGAPQGDLYVEVRIAPDQRFRRQGNELITPVELPVTVAMLGGEVTVPTLEGEAEVEVEPGTQPGDEVVLKGQGLPPLRGGRRGRQRVVFSVVVPSDLSKEQRQLAGQLDESLRSSNGVSARTWATRVGRKKK